MPDMIRPAAEYLQRQLGLNGEETEIALYGIRIIAYSFFGIVSISLVGWLFKCFWETMAVALTAGILRLFSGGAHSRSPLFCVLLGMTVAPFLAKIAALTAGQLSPEALLPVILTGAFLSLLIIYRLAPVDSPAKPITSQQERRKFRLLSVTVMVIIVIIQAVTLNLVLPPGPLLAITLGSCWQAFSLTRAAHRLAFFLDNLIIRGC